MSFAITRRTFLAASSAAIVAVGIDPKFAQGASCEPPEGPVYGRVGKGGLDPGRAGGDVVLVDGRTVHARTEHPYLIQAGRSVWLTRGPDGTLTVLYAEV